VRARPGTTLESIADTLADEGIRIIASDVYDHPRDRTFELRLAGPAVQFEMVAPRLMDRGDIMDVHGGT
jgi:hypothetical protein